MAGLMMDWLMPLSVRSQAIPSVSNGLVVSVNPDIGLGDVDIIKALFGYRLVSEVEVAATALFIYDYLLTLWMEITLVWAAKWNWIKLLYLAQRYTTFIDAIFITIYRHAGVDFTKEHCERMSTATGSLTIIGALGSEILLTIRVWAIWNRTTKFGIALLVGFFAVWIPAAVAGYLYGGSIVYPDNPPYSGFTGCFIIRDKPLIIWCWLGLLVWDLVCLILVAIPGFYTHRAGLSSTTRLTYVVYRDGTVYYLLLFVMSVVNIVFSARLPAYSRVITLSLTRCLHSALASRVLLQLREQIQAAEPEAFTTEVSLDMMGTTHLFDDDDDPFSMPRFRNSGVEDDVDGGSRSGGLNDGDFGGGGGANGATDRRRRGRHSRRRSSMMPTIASGIE